MKAFRVLKPSRLFDAKPYFQIQNINFGSVFQPLYYKKNSTFQKEFFLFQTVAASCYKHNLYISGLLLSQVLKRMGLHSGSIRTMCKFIQIPGTYFML